MPFHPHKMLRNRKDPILVVQQGKKRGRAHALIARAKNKPIIQTDLVPRWRTKLLRHVIIVKCPQSFSLCQHPITTRCEPSAISGALSFWVEKPGRIFCFKGAEQISSIKIWNGGKCVPFEISFSVFLKRLDTNHLE